MTNQDNPEWTDEMLAKAQKGAAASKLGRPKAISTKEAISIRLDHDVLAYFKTTGKGWQTRVNDVLREHVSKVR